MGLIKNITDFLFGKDPDIFDDKGRVSHKLPKKKWDNWNEKFVKSEEYDWRKHTGSLAGKASSQSNNKQN